MYTLAQEIQAGGYRLGLVEKVEIHRSVELLADTAAVTLPGADMNRALRVEERLRRGDPVSIRLGYAETGLREEFKGWLQRIRTDNGSITLECEDDLFLFRVPLPDGERKGIALQALLGEVAQAAGGGFAVDCTYEYTYEKFVFRAATGYDVLQKVQEDSGADIYIAGRTLHVHPPATRTGGEAVYDFHANVESCDLAYARAADRPVRVVVKAVLPDGTVREAEAGVAGGSSIEVRSPSADEASMRRRAESELQRRSFDGYDGSITTWLIPYVEPGYAAVLRDRDYEYKDGTYFVQAVTTEFSRHGGKRTIELGFRLS